MTESNLAAIMQRHPTLTAWGFLDPNDDRFESGRQYLAERGGIVGSCVQWLDSNQPLLRGRSTYCVKHYVERWLSDVYCPQGCLIAAALHLEIPFAFEAEGGRF